jgi:hypothetical protein
MYTQHRKKERAGGQIKNPTVKSPSPDVAFYGGRLETSPVAIMKQLHNSPMGAEAAKKRTEKEKKSCLASSQRTLTI